MKKKIMTFIIALGAIATFGSMKMDANAQIYSDPDGSTFDAQFYATTYPDVAAALGTDKEVLCNHYITVGKAEGRFPNATLAAKAAEANATSPIVAEPVVDNTIAQTNPETVVNPMDDGVYNILAIGNSITIHPVCNYWWGSWGMAASSAEKDYIHQVALGLIPTYGNVNLDVYRSGWEGSSKRDMMLPNMDEALNNNYDLVVLQLGENVKSLSTFEEDFVTLINYVKQSQPNAKIVLVGDYWYMSGRDGIKQQVAETTGSVYVDISAIRGVSKYRSSIGKKVLGDDGRYHSIYTQDVAMHPNDAGMSYIANRVLELVQ